ncbi:MAG: hypothetical protein JKY65_15135 [Planctomycetes bacterium]|nr:hypothetical protein [Planctomycetota bacterium]
MPQQFQGSLRPLNAVVFERRCAIYTQAATLISDLEQALSSNPTGAGPEPASASPPFRLVVADLRRCLWGNLAFLDRDVIRAFDRLEASVAEGLSAAQASSVQASPVKGEVIAGVRDRLAILHLRLARLLQSQRGLVDLAEISELDPRLEQLMRDEARLEQVHARAQALGEECQALEVEARGHIANEDFSRAARALRRAIRIDPRRAVLRNDLGVVLSLLAKTEEAAAEYRAAIALNEQEPQRRTEEWTTSYYNLGVALRKLAQVSFRAGDAEAGRQHLQNAGESLDAFRLLQQATPGGAGQSRVAEAEQALAEIERRLGVTIPGDTSSHGQLVPEDSLAT